MIDTWTIVAMLVARAELADEATWRALLTEAQITVAQSKLPTEDRAALYAEIARIAEQRR